MADGLDAIRKRVRVNAKNGAGLIELIAPGRVADIIAPDGDPVRDVSLLEKVASVMKDGTSSPADSPRGGRPLSM